MFIDYSPKERANKIIEILAEGVIDLTGTGEPYFLAISTIYGSSQAISIIGEMGNTHIGSKIVSHVPFRN